METNWAAEQLQTIRTLMERSAVYRRTLAPIMTFNGALGIAGAVLCRVFRVDTPRGFVILWVVVAAIALAGSFLLVRRQALKEAEPFWSPPTRRVALAMLPALAVGLFVAVLTVCGSSDGAGDAGVVALIWCVLYGLALHAAGFFMPRGIRLLGWLFIFAGCGFALALLLTTRDGAGGGHGSPLDPLFDGRGLFMGIMFGGLHLAYGTYLYFTEKGKNAS